MSRDSSSALPLRRLPPEPAGADREMVAHRIGNDQVQENAQGAVGHAQEIEISVTIVNPGTAIAQQEGNGHEEPVGHVRPGKEGCRKDGSLTARHRPAKPDQELPVKGVLLQQSPG